MSKLKIYYNIICFVIKKSPRNENEKSLSAD